MKKKIGSGVFALVALAAVIGLLRDRSPGDSGDSQRSHDAFGEEGSFKDNDGNRIYTFEIPPDASAQTVRTYAEGLGFTHGVETAAYFYPESAAIPLHSVTFASTVEQAKRVIYETRGFSPWRYAFMRTPEGKVQLVDCRQKPDDGLCRKK